jgi:hypothetical protein
MVFEGNAYGVRDLNLWRERVTVMVLDSNSSGVKE